MRVEKRKPEGRHAEPTQQREIDTVRPTDPQRRDTTRPASSARLGNIRRTSAASTRAAASHRPVALLMAPSAGSPGTEGRAWAVVCRGEGGIPAPRAPGAESGERRPPAVPGRLSPTATREPESPPLVGVQGAAPSVSGTPEISAARWCGAGVDRVGEGTVDLVARLEIAVAAPSVARNRHSATAPGVMPGRSQCAITSCRYAAPSAGVSE